jgi:hypothetical protein
MLVMLQFDSVGQAHAWHDSRRIRRSFTTVTAASTNAWLVKGVAPEQQ